jgi:outer membrane receptor for ferrienterochelin and colicin
MQTTLLLQSETYLNSISLDEIERIEIIKGGPQVSIYGAGAAAGGVISISQKVILKRYKYIFSIKFWIIWNFIEFP